MAYLAISKDIIKLLQKYYILRVKTSRITLLFTQKVYSSNNFTIFAHDQLYHSIFLCGMQGTAPVAKLKYDNLSSYLYIQMIR